MLVELWDVDVGGWSVRRNDTDRYRMMQELLCPLQAAGPFQYYILLLLPLPVLRCSSGSLRDFENRGALQIQRPADRGVRPFLSALFPLPHGTQLDDDWYSGETEKLGASCRSISTVTCAYGAGKIVDTRSRRWMSSSGKRACEHATAMFPHIACGGMGKHQ
jgi:hypothetical protein